MTLKEKFKKTLQKNFTINDIEEIADEFAIEFAEWLNDNYIVSSDFLWLECDTMIKRTTKELLEMYKKKKGL